MFLLNLLGFLRINRDTANSIQDTWVLMKVLIFWYHKCYIISVTFYNFWFIVSSLGYIEKQLFFVDFFTSCTPISITSEFLHIFPSPLNCPPPKPLELIKNKTKQTGNHLCLPYFPSPNHFLLCPSGIGSCTVSDNTHFCPINPTTKLQ